MVKWSNKIGTVSRSETNMWDLNKTLGLFNHFIGTVSVKQKNKAEFQKIRLFLYESLENSRQYISISYKCLIR